MPMPDPTIELLCSPALRRGLSLVFVMAATGSVFSPDPALASATHVVAPGETLSGIAAANGLTTESVAAWNGISPDTYVIAGTTISVPSVDEAGGTGTASTTATASAGTHTVVAGESLSSIAAANGVAIADLAAANGLGTADLLIEGATLQIPAAPAVPAAPDVALGAVYTPGGDVYLEAGAAERWNEMRQASLSTYGVDIYPAGPLSAYRTPEQQAALYQEYLDGTGAPANPPGSSTHQLGLSVDVPTEEMRSIVDEIGWQYGWGKYEAPDEWWHVSYGGG
jgi:LysM repeat protein